MNPSTHGPLPFISFGSLQLPTYFVVLSVLTLGLVFWINERSRQKHYSGTTAFDLFFAVVLSGAIGARLFHVIFEEWNYYQANPTAILMFWNGGFVFYGGLIFGFLGGWIALQIKKQSFLSWLDFFTPVVSLGYAGGRIACFLTGCCYGKVCDLPWAISSRHPTQLYAVVLELILFFTLLKIEKSQWSEKREGGLFFFWLLCHSVSRFFIELFRDDPRGIQFATLSLSMLLSAVFVVVSLQVLRHLNPTKN
jgi:phosphatidylglycerol---prolipoprotein diacylglyceryl transferase